MFPFVIFTDRFYLSLGEEGVELLKKIFYKGEDSQEDDIFSELLKNGFNAKSIDWFYNNYSKFTPPKYNILYLGKTCRINFIDVEIENNNYYEKDNNYFIGKNIISYLNYNKIDTNNIESNWFKSREKTSGAKVLKILINSTKKEIRNKELLFDAKLIEKINDNIKSFIKKSTFNITIVEGEKLRECYLIDNYVDVGNKKTSPLHNSCMAEKNKQEFLDLYVMNPEKIKLLVMKNDDDKIVARALIWYCDDGDIVVDRAYVTELYMYNIINNYCIKREWKKKSSETSTEKLSFLGEPENKNIIKTITLNEVYFDYYPYLDTFCFLDRKKKIITNSEKKLKSYIVLREVDGTITSSFKDYTYNELLSIVENYIYYEMVDNIPLFLLIYGLISEDYFINELVERSPLKFEHSEYIKKSFLNDINFEIEYILRNETDYITNFFLKEKHLIPKLIEKIYEEQELETPKEKEEYLDYYLTNKNNPLKDYEKISSDEIIEKIELKLLFKHNYHSILSIIESNEEILDDFIDFYYHNKYRNYTKREMIFDRYNKYKSILDISENENEEEFLSYLGNPEIDLETLRDILYNNLDQEGIIELAENLRLI